MNRALTLVLLCAVACAENTATRYVGTAMNSATPESPGSVELTFFARDDTSFTGVIKLGAPLTGTGSAYAWHEDGELRVVTVGAIDGDTILWSSRQTGAEVGGTFDVIGGSGEGQSGTWRAQLTMGLPTSAETMATPEGTPHPPVSALWPLLVLLVVAGAGFQWVRHLPPKATDESELQPNAIGRVKLGGWLTLFTLGQAGMLLVSLFKTRSVWSDYVSSMGFAAATAGMEPLLVMETAFQLLAPAAIATGLILTLRRSAYTPRYWFTYFGITASYLIIDSAFSGMLGSELRSLLGDDFDPIAADLNRERVRMVSATIGNFVWMTYWARSERVRRTFGATALDQVRREPRDYGPVLTPEQRVAVRRRYMAWGGLAVVAVVVVLYLIGRTIRVDPYLVAEGTDIRDVVAGRWSWTTEKPPCGDAAHIIAFEDSGTVMTIRSSDIAADSGVVVTTYDITQTTRSSIRGAIRGETRMTDDGKPVVWDLVLVGPSEYRWHRTDWPLTAVSYTGAVKRCPPTPPDSVPR